MNNRTGIFFTISTVFAVFGIIFSLICGASVVSTDNDSAKISSEIEQLENEISVLRVKMDSKYSLEELESYAKNILLMENMRPENVILLSIEVR